MYISRLKVRRFLSFGDNWTEIDFTKLGNIVNIKGTNLDYGEEASNGAGKSTILSAITYALYGKTLKNLSHKNVNHIYSKKGFELEIEVDNLLIKRSGSPHELQLFENGIDISPGGVPATQEEINKRLKLNYTSFINVACFGQHSLHGFLEGDASHKREIAENLLGLDQYANYHESAKKQRSYIQEKIRDLEIYYDVEAENLRRANSKIITLRGQQSSWQRGRMNEITNMEVRLNTINKEIDSPKDNRANKELARVDEEILKAQSKRKQILSTLKEVESKYDSISKDRETLTIKTIKTETQLREITATHKQKLKSLEEIQQRKGSRCPSCFGVVREENINVLTENLKNELNASAKLIKQFKTTLELEKEELSQAESRHAKVSEMRNKYKQLDKESSLGLTSLTMERAQWAGMSGSEGSSLLKEKELIEQRIAASRDELKNNDPFTLLLRTTEDEVKEAADKMDRHKSDLDQKRKLLPYYEYWVKGFGDKGVRSFILERKIPLLNSRVNFWLQVLIDNRLKLYFDRDLNETIRRCPDDSKKFVYSALSGSEMSRIDLSISQAFAYVTMASAGGQRPSILSLDEIGNNFDRPSMYAIYRMICELANEGRQVLVITHNKDLLEMLGTCDTITAEMKNGVTSLKICKM